MNVTDAQRRWDAYVAADDAWQQALVAAFGKDAGQARYEPRGHGEAGTPLRAARDAYVAARDEWHAVPRDFDVKRHTTF